MGARELQMPMILALPLPGDSPPLPGIPIFSPLSGECHAGHSRVGRIQWAHECKIMGKPESTVWRHIRADVKNINHHFPPGRGFIFQVPWFNSYPQELMMVIFLPETLLPGPLGVAL